MRPPNSVQRGWLRRLLQDKVSIQRLQQYTLGAPSVSRVQVRPIKSSLATNPFPSHWNRGFIGFSADAGTAANQIWQDPQALTLSLPCRMLVLVCRVECWRVACRHALGLWGWVGCFNFSYKHNFRSNGLGQIWRPNLSRFMSR